MDLAVAPYEQAVSGGNGLPFAADHLDRLMDDANLDVLVLTSKHNIQYLLGGYRFFFFDAMDAIGVSRYLPVIVYVKGRPQDSGYIGNTMESYERELGKFWMPTVLTNSWSSVEFGRAGRRTYPQTRPPGEADRRGNGVRSRRCLPRLARGPA